MWLMYADNIGSSVANVIDQDSQLFKFDHSAPGSPASGNPAVVNSRSTRLTNRRPVSGSPVALAIRAISYAHSTGSISSAMTASS
jgi:hypothetical protein